MLRHRGSYSGRRRHGHGHGHGGHRGFPTVGPILVGRLRLLLDLIIEVVALLLLVLLMLLLLLL